MTEKEIRQALKKAEGEFIDKVVVHAPIKNENGKRCQQVDIYLKFIGKVDI
jgi:hypothetical protein